jgi:hypothetical protein
MAAPQSNEKASDAHRELPSKEALDKAGEHMIQDENGNEIAFKTLYTDKPADERQLIIFVRHFFCGVSHRHNLAWSLQILKPTD